MKTRTRRLPNFRTLARVWQAELRPYEPLTARELFELVRSEPKRFPLTARLLDQIEATLSWGSQRTLTAQAVAVRLRKVYESIPLDYGGWAVGPTVRRGTDTWQWGMRLITPGYPRVRRKKQQKRPVAWNNPLKVR